MSEIAEPSERRPGQDTRDFVRRCLIVVLIAAIAGILWTVSHTLLLLFGAILFAVVLRGLARLLRRVVPVGPRLSVIIVMILLLAAGGGLLTLFGSQMSAQFSQIAQRLPDSLARVEDALRRTGWGQPLIDQLDRLDDPAGGSGGQGSGQQGQNESQGQKESQVQEQAADGGGGGAMGLNGALADSVGWLVRTAGGLIVTLADAVSQLVLVLFGAVFLALQPRLYRQGVRRMVPDDIGRQIEQAMDRTGQALWLWAAGTLVDMMLIGTVTGLGLWLLGVPAPLALGLIAGVLEFIPFVGPLLAALPAVLLALTVDPMLALWTALFYLVLQQLEGNLILPLIQRRAVDLPPVVGIFALLVFGSLFGVIGVLFAVPLAVATLTLIQVLWVQETLHKPDPPGKDGDAGQPRG